MTPELETHKRADELLNEARRWVLRMRSGEASRAEVDALTNWRDRSPAHRWALAEANAQWDLARAAAQNIARRPAAGGAAANASLPFGTLSRRAWLGGAMAASIGGAVYLAARPPLDLWPSLAELGADYRTDVGERRQLVLANAASVEMNTRTSLAVPGSDATVHQIELIAGEITVTTRQADRHTREPFVVVAGNGRASAAQATFDLRHDGDTVTVTCLEGEVLVECRNDEARLGPRQKIAYGAHGIGALVSTDPRMIDAWRRGLLVFDNLPLASVIPEINRYRRGRIVLLNDEVGRLPLDATFRLDRIEEVVPKIAHIFDLKVRTLPGGLVLLG